MPNPFPNICDHRALSCRVTTLPGEHGERCELYKCPSRSSAQPGRAPSRPSFMGQRHGQSPCAPYLKGFTSGLTLCGCHLEILSHCLTRSPRLRFARDPENYRPGPGMMTHSNCGQTDKITGRLGMSGSGSFHIKTQLPKTIRPIRFSDKPPAPQTRWVSRGFPNCYPPERTLPPSCLYGAGPVTFPSAPPSIFEPLSAAESEHVRHKPARPPPQVPCGLTCSSLFLTNR